MHKEVPWRDKNVLYLDLGGHMSVYIGKKSWSCALNICVFPLGKLCLDEVLRMG